MIATRREFIVATGAAACALLAAPSGIVAAEPPPLKLSAARRRSLLAALKSEASRYDPAAKMVVGSAGGPGYHTTLKSGQVHGTRASLVYAAALLDSGAPADLQRAQDILRTLIALQDQDSASKTYGIWSWYLEEPLGKMSPPDWNWADFCGVQLLHAWIHHRHRLDPDLAGRLRESILHAARSIRRRNVGPGYTNIAIMGTYVTLVAGEQLNDQEILRYGQDRLRRVHAFTFEQGSFAEYNSPTYTVVALTELSRMLLHVQADADRRLVREIHDFAWKHIATHFHAPTRQWAGPHSRSYDLRKRGATLAIIQEGTGVNLTADDPLPLGLDACRLQFDCPKDLRSHFARLESPRTTVETFAKADAKRSGAKNPVVGTTFLHPAFTLGTINRGDLWNQRRPVLSYWGDAGNVTWLRVRFLHDGYDYTSALVFAAQHEGSALITIGFASDYGDTHPSLNKPPVPGQLKARELRLRFEFGGTVEPLKIELGDAGWKAIDGRCALGLQLGAEAFGNEKLRWEQGSEAGKRFIDRVVCSGEERTFDLKSLGRAFITFGLRIDQAAAAPLVNAPEVKLSGDTVESSWLINGRVLRLASLAGPAPLGKANDASQTDNKVR